MSLPLPDQALPLRIEWERGWNNFTLHYGDQPLGTAAERADLEVGHIFRLPDGQRLIVVLRDPELEVWYRGTDIVNGIASGQRDPFSASAKSLQTIGGLQFLCVPVYWFILPSYIQWPMAVVMGASGLFLIFFWKKMYSPRYKQITWFALAACITVIPMFLFRRGGIELIWNIMEDLTKTLNGVPPRFPTSGEG